MKISKLFHWLYFIVMMIPIMVFPIFALAVRSDNNFQPISVNANVNNFVHVEQLIETAPINDWESSDNHYMDMRDGEYYLSAYENSDGVCYFDYNLDVIDAHKYLCKFDYFTIGSFADSIQFVLEYTDESENILEFDFVVPNSSTSVTYEVIQEYSGTSFTTDDVGFYLWSDAVGGGSITFDNLQLFDLTSMYGIGNEPSVSQFNNDFPNDYYAIDSNATIISSTVVTYNDTDVGSQMVYVGYRVVDNYFNYDKVFNFGSLYYWLEINFFSGSAPLGFFIFWHLLIYWLLTSLLWLLFDVLMYVPQLIHRWLDKASLS